MTASEPLRVTLGRGERLDKALAAAVPTALALSRSRLQALIGEGAVALGDGTRLDDPRLKLAPGTEVVLTLPEPRPIHTQAEAIPLVIVFEDAHLIVVDKPAGLVVHPAPGAPDGTLVNALLHHCGGSLSGIGGRLRPGIVHRIDKDTSGLLVVAKSDVAHRGLARAVRRARHRAALPRGGPRRPRSRRPPPRAPRRHQLGAGRRAPHRGQHRPASRRPQAHGGPYRGRQVGGHPRARPRALRPRRRARRGAGRMPAGDRPHPPDPRPHGLRRPSAGRRHRLRPPPRDGPARQLPAPGAARHEPRLHPPGDRGGACASRRRRRPTSPGCVADLRRSNESAMFNELESDLS